MFEEQASTKSTMRAATTRGPLAPESAIAGYIELNSGELLGRFVIYLPKHSFLTLFKNMFEVEQNEITDDMKDGAAEFVNIIYGLAKTELNIRGFRFEPAFPKVAMNDEIPKMSRSRPAVVVPFDSVAGPFHIEIEFNSEN